MGLLFRLLSVFAAASRPAVRPLLAVSSGIGVAKRSQIPDDMYYGMYALRDRYCFRRSHGCLGIRLLHSSECVYHIMIIFENFHEISFNFTGTSVKLSVQHMRYFTVPE